MELRCARCELRYYSLFIYIFIYLYTYHLYGVTWVTVKREIIKTLQQRYPITLRLSNNEIRSNDELMRTETQTKKIQRAVSTGVGVDIKISKSHRVFTSCCVRRGPLLSEDDAASAFNWSNGRRNLVCWLLLSYIYLMLNFRQVTMKRRILP